MNWVNELTNKIIGLGSRCVVHSDLVYWSRRMSVYSSTATSSNSRRAFGASSMRFQNNLRDLRVLGGEYVTAIRARSTSFLRNPLPTCE